MNNKVRSKTKYRVKKRFFLMLFVFGYVVLCFGQQFNHINKIDREIEGYLQIKNELIQEQESLKKEIALLDNESYIERIAREDLGLIKPGEMLLVPGQQGNLPEVKPLKELKDNIH